MRRREFLGVAAAAAAAPMAWPVAAQGISKAELDAVKTRKVGKVQIVYKSPHAHPTKQPPVQIAAHVSRIPGAPRRATYPTVCGPCRF